MKIIIAGGGGFIGAPFARHLQSRGHEVLRISRAAPRIAGDIQWDPTSGVLDATALESCDVVVNMVGDIVVGTGVAALRGSYGGVMMFGIMGKIVGLALINPVSLVLGGLLTVRTVKELRKQSLNQRRHTTKVDGQKYIVNVPSMTGRQLLELAGKTPPEKFMIVEKVRGEKPRRIGLDEEVDFTKRGVEKFLTQPLGQTEG